MNTAHALTVFIDWFYFPWIRKVIPLQTFRYAVCGGSNLLLNWILYAVTYNFLLGKLDVDLGFITISPHIAAFLIVFPITFFSGFWLQKHIAFHSSPLKSHVQLTRYLFSVAGSIVLNYLCLKFFVDVLNVYPTPSQIMSSFVTIAYSYVMQKYYTFRGCISGK